MNLFEIQSNWLPETELDRYVHTKAFQEWLMGDRSMIVCTTSRKDDDTPRALGACIAKYVATQTCCHLLYVDCYWVLQTAQQGKQKSLANNLLTSELKPGLIKGEALVDLVLESIYCQLFRSCMEQEEILESYNSSLTRDEAVLFQSQLLESGTPQQNHLWALTQCFLQSTTTQVLICIDRINELEESSRARLMLLLGSLKSMQKTPKILVSGYASTIDQDSLLGTPVISEETETHGNYQFS